MYLKSWIDKIQAQGIYICILFFADRHCHVSMTTRKPDLYIRTLTRQFAQKGFSVTNTESFFAGYHDHWHRVSEKYIWRYLLHCAGYKIVNQDGSVFDQVEAETWDNVKICAEKELQKIKMRPAISIIRAECKMQKVKFLPKQSIRRLITRSHDEQREYSSFEKTLLNLDRMPSSHWNLINFKKGKLSYA